MPSRRPPPPPAKDENGVWIYAVEENSPEAGSCLDGDQAEPRGAQAEGNQRAIGTLPRHAPEQAYPFTVVILPQISAVRPPTGLRGFDVAADVGR